MSDAQLCKRLDSLSVPRGLRTLVLGGDGLVRAMRERGLQVTPWADPERIEFPDESFDVAVVGGAFGGYEWDRWLLQELQRVLVPGGRLLFDVPNLMSMVTPRDWGFLLQRVSVQADRSLRKALKQPPRAYPFHGRKYRIDRVLPVLPPLGWLDVACDPAPKPSPMLEGWTVTATRGPSRFGVEPSRPYPPLASHRAAYEGANGNFLEMRARWIAAHPEFRCDVPKPFDPAPYAGRTVLVLAPHPDDEIIGPGGTLARLIAAGATVTSLQATDGSEGAALRDATPEERRSIRLREAQLVSDTIGFAETVYWRADNGNFRATDALVGAMRELLDRVKPSLVFTPFLADIHPDHLTLNRLFARALPGASVSPRVLQYEVWGLVPANVWSDVTPQSALIEKLLRLYRTAMKVDDYVHFCEERNAYHSLLLGGQPGLAEAFLESSADDYRRVADPAE